MMLLLGALFSANNNTSNCRSGEMADALDSKSSKGNTLCGFESHLRYLSETNGLKVFGLSTRFLLRFASDVFGERM